MSGKLYHRDLSNIRTIPWRGAAPRFGLAKSARKPVLLSRTYTKMSTKWGYINVKLHTCNKKTKKTHAGCWCQATRALDTWHYYMRVNCGDLRQYKRINGDKRQVWRSHIVKGLCDLCYETVGCFYVVLCRPFRPYPSHSKFVLIANSCFTQRQASMANVTSKHSKR